MKTKNKWLLRDIHKRVDRDTQSLIFPIELKDKSWKMTEIHKKIKHLNHTIIVWAEDNKYPTNPGNPGTDYVIPPRVKNDVVMSEWKDDLKFVSKLDFMLGDGKTLTKKELQMSNQLYEFYSQMSMKNLLRK